MEASPTNSTARARANHGGVRPGAGRPRKEGAVSHLRRPSVSPSAPLHVTLRFEKHVWNLRSQRCLRPIDRALRSLLAREEAARVTHFSVQGNHVHLVVEARDRRALSSAMRSLSIRIARGLNAVMGRRRGKVIAARYHARALRSRTDAKNVVRYVLANHARHVPGAAVADPWSSAPGFRAWDAIGLPPASVAYALPSIGPPVSRPRSGLLLRALERR